MKKLMTIILVGSCFLTIAQKQIINDPNAQPRQVSGFIGIKVSHAIDLYLSQGNEEAVAVSASKDEYRDKIKTVVENGILKIWYDEDSKFWKNTGNKRLKAYISFKSLNSLSASGASDVTVTGAIKTGDLTLNMSGASDFKGSVQANTLEVDLSGASDALISGTVASLNVEASGASDFKGYDLVTDNCTADASGASDISVTVNKELNAYASGASGVHFKGNGVIKQTKSSGASSINKRG